MPMHCLRNFLIHIPSAYQALEFASERLKADVGIVETAMRTLEIQHMHRRVSSDHGQCRMARLIKIDFDDI